MADAVVILGGVNSSLYPFASISNVFSSVVLTMIFRRRGSSFGLSLNILISNCTLSGSMTTKSFNINTAVYFPSVSFSMSNSSLTGPLMPNSFNMSLILLPSANLFASISITTLVIEFSPASAPTYNSTLLAAWMPSGTSSFKIAWTSSILFNISFNAANLPCENSNLNSASTLTLSCFSPVFFMLITRNTLSAVAAIAFVFLSNLITPVTSISNTAADISPLSSFSVIFTSLSFKNCPNSSLLSIFKNWLTCNSMFSKFNSLPAFLSSIFICSITLAKFSPLNVKLTDDSCVDISYLIVTVVFSLYAPAAVNILPTPLPCFIVFALTFTDIKWPFSIFTLFTSRLSKLKSSLNISFNDAIASRAALRADAVLIFNSLDNFSTSES